MPDSWKSPLAGVPPEFAKLGHPVWKDIEPEINAHEFKHPYEMDVHFLRLLHRVRKLADVPFRLLSDARDEDGDVGASKSAHKKRPCRAVDLMVKNTYERARIVIAAIRCGIVRLGIYPQEKNSLHLDAEDSEENASPRIWTAY